MLPVIGKSALEKYWSDKPDTKNISWKPFKAEAAKSGDLVILWELEIYIKRYYYLWYVLYYLEKTNRWQMEV